MDYKTENLWLMKGDCLERMREIPDKSVDLILTDPPYGTTACKWDSVIPFEEMWKGIKRVIKPSSATVLFGIDPFSSYLRASNIEWFKYDWIWLKSRPSGIMNAKLRPMSTHEIISVFSDGKTSNGNKNNMRYFPQGIKKIDRVTRSPSKPREGAENSYSRPSHKEFYTQEFTNYPRTILEFGKDEKEKLHPTQKPVALLEYLIKTYTLEGETVLDFTMGSGSTGVACKNLSRKFIGIERDDRYFHIAQKRILDIKPF